MNEAYLFEEMQKHAKKLQDDGAHPMMLLAAVELLAHGMKSQLVAPTPPRVVPIPAALPSNFRPQIHRRD